MWCHTGVCWCPRLRSTFLLQSHRLCPSAPTSGDAVHFPAASSGADLSPVKFKNKNKKNDLWLIPCTLSSRFLCSVSSTFPMQSSRRSTSMILWSFSTILASAVLRFRSVSSSRLMYSSSWALENETGLAALKTYISSNVFQTFKRSCEECRPAVFLSPPCVSVAPPAVSPHTPVAALLTAPAAPESGPLRKPPPGHREARWVLFEICSYRTGWCTLNRYRLFLYSRKQSSHWLVVLECLFVYGYICSVNIVGVVLPQ